jgi:DNA end-binding protein Ku
MATRVIWKGAITFGLVLIPVGLHTASSDEGIDFDWLDKRTMDPVGYKRVNKRTGKEIDRENIVKGVAYEEGQYVIISPEEIEAAYPRTTQTIEIERFVNASEISFVYLERPYYLEPINKGHKVYALLRDTLAKTGKIAIARVVIQTKQHLAVLVPSGPALVLNLMRWGDEVKSLDGLDLPAVGAKGPDFSAAEKKMAEKLVDDMTGHWEPDAFKDEFRLRVMALVDKKVKAGKTETVIEPAEEAPAETSNVVDLTELLARSLKGRKTTAGHAAHKSAKTAEKATPKAPTRKSPASKRPSSRATTKKPARKAA